MGATYFADLRSDKDWVRFLVGDRDVDADSTSGGGRGPRLSDEEINSLLVEEGNNKYLAAARAGEVILAQGRDVVEKAVGDLKIKYGNDASSAYRMHLSTLREKGAEMTWRQGGGSHVLKIV